jgi:hypothetical protein
LIATKAIKGGIWHYQTSFFKLEFDTELLSFVGVVEPCSLNQKPCFSFVLEICIRGGVPVKFESDTSSLLFDNKVTIDNKTKLQPLNNKTVTDNKISIFAIYLHASKTPRFTKFSLYFLSFLLLFITILNVSKFIFIPIFCFIFFGTTFAVQFADSSLQLALAT